ncbi:GMC family oxidoreductase [Mycobacterium sp.]|uniref:GMC family oxidoreductase n=1 Tax=Mycobacterium sp. TaxID=1785 RepID=UPI003BAF26D6
MTPQRISHAAERDFARRVRDNQARLKSVLREAYDFVVCGAGTAGSVVARRLAENPDVSVLLLEAGGDDDVPSVTNPLVWPENLGTELDWGFLSEPNPQLGGRRLQMSMGKVLGGGSSINAMAWSRGHASDWDLFAAEADDQSWSYGSILDIYRRIEDWAGTPDPKYRGVGGEVFLQPPQDPHPVAVALHKSARSLGIPVYEHPNGRLMENGIGVAFGDFRIRDGRRLSMFRSYTYPYMDRPNLTVLTRAVVHRLTFDDRRVVGVEVKYGGRVRRIAAAAEVIVSLGAINTPKLLMLSGLGDAQDLRAVGIPVVQQLRGVGQNLQDHTAFDCVWEYCDDPLPPRNNGSEAVIFDQFDATSVGPDMFVWQAQMPLSTPENIAEYGLPEYGWTLFSAIAHPKSRGRVTISGSAPEDPVLVQTNALSHPEDLVAARRCVALCREIGNAAPLSQFVRREVMPGDLSGAELDEFIRCATRTFWHQSGTAKMGRGENAVVDSHLRVYGVENLRIADGSIMPRITTANTMAPCVIIGEKAAGMIKTTHHI